MEEKRVINDTTITLDTVPIEVSPHVFGGVRSVIIITNTSLAGETVSIGILAQAKANQGVVLYPGDKFAASKDAGYTPSPEQITAVASANTATIALHEEIDLF